MNYLQETFRSILKILKPYDHESPNEIDEKHES